MSVTAFPIDQISFSLSNTCAGWKPWTQTLLAAALHHQKQAPPNPRVRLPRRRIFKSDSDKCSWFWCNKKMQNCLLSPLRFVYSGDPETLSPCQMVDDEVVPAQLTAERSPDIITMTLYTSRPLTRIKGLAAPCFQTYIFLKIIFGYFWHAPHCWDAELHHTTCEHGMVHKNGTGGWTVEAEFIGIDTVSYQCYTSCWAWNLHSLRVMRSLTHYPGNLGFEMLCYEKVAAVRWPLPILLCTETALESWTPPAGTKGSTARNPWTRLPASLCSHAASMISDSNVFVQYPTMEGLFATPGPFAKALSQARPNNWVGIQTGPRMVLQNLHLDSLWGCYCYASWTFFCASDER